MQQAPVIQGSQDHSMRPQLCRGCQSAPAVCDARTVLMAGTGSDGCEAVSPLKVVVQDHRQRLQLTVGQKERAPGVRFPANCCNMDDSVCPKQLFLCCLLPMTPFFQGSN